MLKRFFITALGSFVGTWLALIISSVMSILLSFAMLGALANSEMKSTSKISDNSVLLLDLGIVVSDRGSNDDVFSSIYGDTKTVGLIDLLRQIESASEKKEIKGMLITCKGISAGMSSLYEIREAIARFRETGKFVYAYGYQAISQADYYLASQADSIFINPEAVVDLHGLASQNLLFKRLLDKVGVEMQVLRVGTYKSAVEPYMLSQISEANRRQQEHYMGSIWNTIAKQMATSRHLSVERINELADSMTVAKGSDYMLSVGLVDGICYRQEMEAKLKKLVDEDYNLVKPNSINVNNGVGSGNEVAVVYCEGEIDGSEDSGIISNEVCETIYNLADNDDVCAMVLRVNSPGGSAFGSEQIWKAVTDFKAKDKKVVVSMGDLAASGGYYISCGADYIYAEPITLTGSIGIFGVIPCIKQLSEETLGINVDVVKTNANGDFGSLLIPLSDYQREAMQQYINRGYDLFTRRCADGRGVSQDSIKSIAEGRVWDGRSAKEIGLVDEFGSLNDAIAKAAELQDLGEDYYVAEYPEVKDRWQRMMERYMNDRAEAKMRSELGVLYEYHKVLKQVLGRQHMLCLMEPLEIK
ncbi:MAG: signal peptide peptidase SppA [Muribaculaceae bacterium]